MVAKVAEGNALKWKSEEQGRQVEKLMETVDLLKEKRRKIEWWVSCGCMEDELSVYMYVDTLFLQPIITHLLVAY